MIPDTGARPRRSLLMGTGIFHSPGGVAAVNRLVIHALGKAGSQVDVLALNEAEAEPDARYIDPAVVACRGFHGNKQAYALAVWWSVLKTRYDLIVVDHVNVASILAPLSLFGFVRYVVWLCGIEVFPPRPDFEGRLGLKHAWRRLAISDFTRQSVQTGFSGLPVEVCELALDPVQHRPASGEELAADRPAPVWLEAVNGAQHRLGHLMILTVGRMSIAEQYKGQDTLLRAFPAIRQQFSEAQLVLVGSGDDRPRLLALARSLPEAAPQAVFMPGHVDDEMLDALYRQSFVFAMPSTGEGFGLVYLEAMSRGKPCVGGKLDATPGVVQDGLTGALVDDPRSSAQLAAAIMGLMADPERARQMGLAGYRRVQSCYLFTHFEQRFWEALGAAP